MEADEERLKSWLSACSGIPVPRDASLFSYLHSGVVLCKSANCITKDAIKKISTLPSAYAHMENISHFTDYLRFKLQMRDADLFVTVDLYEQKNFRQVVHSLLQLGTFVRTLPQYDGPQLSGDVKSAYLKSDAAPSSSASTHVPRTISIDESSQPTAANTKAAKPSAPSKPAPKVPSSSDSTVSASAVPPTVPRAKRNSVTGPSTTSSSSSTSHSAGSSDREHNAWQTLNTVQQDVYALQSSLRELQLTDQHKSATLGVLQQMIKMQDERNLSVQAELQALKKETNGLAAGVQQTKTATESISTSNKEIIKAVKAVEASASSKNHVSSEEFQKLASDLKSLTTILKQVTAKSEAQQREIEQLKLDQQAALEASSVTAAASAAAASAAAAASKHDDAAASSNATHAEIESLKLQLSQVRSQLHQTQQSHSNTFSQSNAQVRELSNTVESLKQELTQVNEAQRQQAAKPSVTVSSTPPSADPAIQSQFTQVAVDLTKAKKQNVSLKEAMIKLNTRMEDDHEKQEKHVLELTNAVQLALTRSTQAQKEAQNATNAALAAATSASAAASAAASRGADSAVNAEEFAQVKKIQAHLRKTQKVLEDNFDILSAALEATANDSQLSLADVKTRLDQQANVAASGLEAKVASHQQAIDGRLSQVETTLTEQIEKLHAELKKHREIVGAAAVVSNGSIVVSDADASSPTPLDKNHPALDSIRADIDSIRVELAASLKTVHDQQQTLDKRLEIELKSVQSNMDLMNHSVSTATASIASTESILTSFKSSFSSLEADFPRLKTSFENFLERTYADDSLAAQQSVSAIRGDVSWLREKCLENEESSEQHSKAQEEFLVQIQSIQKEIQALSANKPETEEKPASLATVESLLSTLRTDLTSSFQEKMRAQVKEEERKWEKNSHAEKEQRKTLDALKHQLQEFQAENTKAFAVLRQTVANQVQVAPAAVVKSDASDSTPEVDESGVFSRRSSAVDEFGVPILPATNRGRVNISAAATIASSNQPLNQVSEGDENSESEPTTGETAVVIKDDLALSSGHRASIAVLKDEDPSVMSLAEGSNFGRMSIDSDIFRDVRPTSGSVISTIEEGRSISNSISSESPLSDNAISAASATASAVTEPEANPAAAAAAAAAAASVSTPVPSGHRPSSAELLANQYAEEMAKMREAYETRLEDERRAKEAAELLLQKRRESISANSTSASFFASSTASSARSSVDYTNMGMPPSPSSSRTSRRESSLHPNNNDSTSFAASEAINEEEEEDEEENDEPPPIPQPSVRSAPEDEVGRDFLSSKSAPAVPAVTATVSSNLFSLDSASSPVVSAPTSVPLCMADMEAELARMKADFERRVAEEREMTQRKKLELLQRRDTANSISSSAPPTPSAHSQHQQYTPMVVETTEEEEQNDIDPALEYYKQTVQSGPSEVLRNKMLPIINASRRAMAAQEVGEDEAVRLQANLDIMRNTLIGRRKAIIEESDDESDGEI